MEDFSLPESPEVAISVGKEDHGGPEPDTVPLDPATVIPEAGALRAEAMRVQEWLTGYATCCRQVAKETLRYWNTTRPVCL